MPSLFVDTSVWYAAADSSDAGNARAKALLGAGEPLVTSDHVLIETWTLLRYRIRRQVADLFWDSLRSGVSSIETVGSADLEAAWQIGISWRDQDFSIVDRTSFAVMRRLGIERAASFDADFAIFRFGPHRRRAFTILR
ncbi:MAG TPA: PIN domain-containing protein [Bryobacteraceae bacterium]|jgi:predicted nucleic acid-binding protein